jgi:protein-disulfide isomerase
MKVFKAYMHRISAVLVISALSLFLAACGDSSNGSKQADESGAAQQTEATKTASTQSKADVLPPEGSVDVMELMKPGALPDKSLGKADAPVTVIEYASTTCSHCAHFANTTFEPFKKKYIDTGKVYFIMREFPFDPRAEAGFMLARCAGDNYFPMIEVLFKQQEEWARAKNASEALLKIARLAGFSQESFNACLTDQKLLDKVRAVRDRASKEFGVDATPTFFINGDKYAGALDIDQMSAIIDSKL